MDKRLKLLFTAIAMALLIALVSTSYAYFSIANNKGNVTTINTGTMSIEYNDGDLINVTDIIPGDHVDKIFTVRNTGTLPVKYDIYLDEVVNTFEDQSDLVYELISNDGGYNTPNQVQAPNATTKIVDGQTLAVSGLHTYTLRITFLNKNENQNDNQGKQFSAKIRINTYQDNNEGNNTGIDGFTPISYVTSDTSGASTPEVYDGLIPVVYDDMGNTLVADISQEWYNYDNHEWANAVLVKESARNKTAGQIFSADEILQYYVWIPRYKYQIVNADFTGAPQILNVEFENKNIPKSDGDENGEWLTHPAFTFGNTELNGFWISKFRMTGSESTTSNPTNLTSIPTTTAITNKSISDMFYMTRSLDTTYGNSYGLLTTQIDSHLTKNMEWGAVAYLTNSIYGRYLTNTTCVSSGCYVWPNNNSNFITGCAGNSINASANSSCTYKWNSENGKHSSTTDNQYGVYDMSGKSNSFYDYVMANIAVDTATYDVDTQTFSYENAYYRFMSGSSGFEVDLLDKYVDRYNSPIEDFAAYDRSGNFFELGDATKEFTYNGVQWDGCNYNCNQGSSGGGGGVWLMRTSLYGYSNLGISGQAMSMLSFHNIITIQDGTYNGNGLKTNN